MMVKFDTRNAAGYRTALDKLRQFAKDAPAVVAGRFTQARHRPQPCSTVPFKKDPMFVGREDVISAIKGKHGTIGQCHERVALVGLAGIGDDADGRASLVTFLPQVAHGSVLVTSRNGLAARNLVGTDGLVIHVQPMNEAESLALLRARIAASQSPAEDESALVQALEYIPLAIIQAAAYIANRSPLITVSAYLRLFHESESKRIRLLQNEDSVDLRRDPSIRYAVIATWQLSFEEIQRWRPAATDLLAQMSMFDRQGIPEELMRDEGQDLLDFHDALAPLLGLVLNSQRKYNEAEAMYRRALEECEKVLGREHPNTLTSVDNLCDVLFSQGKYEEAEAMVRWIDGLD
ncbi:hypothetical protein TCE0_051r18458 [Talaromyces pinophilus]|uniref:Kinesin light chain n=1 Tax=Talaromyces pinophilus TaxID=128442 RepID=A0A0B8N5W2_TALPI|nr:hypothetical protein TCE0_051r18458 [Talaromyces pinophilus]